MTTFDDDKAWTKAVRDRVLAPQFYDKYVTRGRYVFLDKGRMARRLQRLSVDTIVQARDGAAVCIEEKIVRWKGYHYRDFTLETHSCTNPGRESEGWMRYGQADYLLYCFHQADDGLICYLIDFPQLQAWFNSREESFPTFGPLETLNASMGRKVPIGDVVRAVKTTRFTCHGRQPNLTMGGSPEVGHAPRW